MTSNYKNILAQNTEVSFHMGAAILDYFYGANNFASFWLAKNLTGVSQSKTDMSDTKSLMFDLEAVNSLFSKSLKQNGEISIDQYIEGYSELCK